MKHKNKYGQSMDKHQKTLQIIIEFTFINFYNTKLKLLFFKYLQIKIYIASSYNV